jgi:peptide methionine sulfoxide reductase MsrA
VLRRTIAKLVTQVYESDMAFGAKLSLPSPAEALHLGTQYRSAIYTYDEAQSEAVAATRKQYQDALTAAGFGEITTEIAAAPTFYYAEHYHQQYLAKVPNGYCGLGGTGVGCDIKPLAVLN